MGNGDSKQEAKTIDSNGQVNNNIVIQEAKDIHQQTEHFQQMLIIMYIRCFLEVIKICIYIYNCHLKKLKKRYQNNNP